MATNRKENPTLAAHVAEASGAEREIESNLAAHLLLVTRSKHQALLERQLESAKARVESLDSRLKELGGSVRSIPKPSKPAKQVKGAAKSAERRATKIATGAASKVRDAGELRRVLEAARDEQEEALKQTAAYNSLRALAKASGDKDTAKLAKRLRDEHKEWAKFLTDELKSLSKKLVKAESEEREKATTRRRSATAKKAASSRSSNGRKSSGAQVVGVELTQVVGLKRAQVVGFRRAQVVGLGFAQVVGRQRTQVVSGSASRKSSGSTARKSSGSAARKSSASASRKSSGSSARKSSASKRTGGSTASKARSTAAKSRSTARSSSGGARKSGSTRSRSTAKRSTAKSS